MPTSHYKNVHSVLGYLDKLYNDKGFRTVLDVGCGFGKYGVLIRERCDIRFKRYNKRDWTTKIDCVESYKPYITPLHTYIYNEIIIGDVFELVDQLKFYDIVLLIDCLEHLSKWKGKQLLGKLYKLTKKAIIISVPDTFRGGECSDWPNKRETHRCLWNKKELDAIIGRTTRRKFTIYTREK